MVVFVVNVVSLIWLLCNNRPNTIPRWTRGQRTSEKTRNHRGGRRPKRHANAGTSKTPNQPAIRAGRTRGTTAGSEDPKHQANPGTNPTPDQPAIRSGEETRNHRGRAKTESPNQPGNEPDAQPTRYKGIIGLSETADFSQTNPVRWIARSMRNRRFQPDRKGRGSSFWVICPPSWHGAAVDVRPLIPSIGWPGAVVSFWPT